MEVVKLIALTTFRKMDDKHDVTDGIFYQLNKLGFMDEDGNVKRKFELFVRESPRKGPDFCFKCGYEFNPYDLKFKKYNKLHKSYVNYCEKCFVQNTKCYFPDIIEESRNENRIHE